MSSPRSHGILLMFAAAVAGCHEATTVDEPPSVVEGDKASTALSRARSVFRAADWLTSDRSVQRDAANAHAVARELDITLPRSLGESLSVAHAGMNVSVRLLDDATKVGAEWNDGVAVFETNAGAVFRVLTARGVDDVYELPTPRQAFVARYEIELANVSGLRLVDGALELVDANGTPRLHVPAPIAMAANGVFRRGAIEVEGCAVDRDPRGPWGRAVTTPGNDRCIVVARVQTEGLAFPVLVDPAWETTGGLKYTHFKHASVVLTTGADAGKVLIVGGGGAYTASTELYDPATRTWSTGSPLPAGADLAEGTRAVVLPNGTVMVAGGIASPSGSTAQTTTYLRDPTTGTWSSGKNMAYARAHHAMSVVTIGGKTRVIVAGGQPQATMSSTVPPIASAEMYAPETDTWTTIGFLKIARSQMASVVLADGRMAIIGGESIVSTSVKQVDTTEIYDATLDGWISGPKLTTTRTGMSVAPLEGSKFVVAGGYGVVSGSLSATMLNTIEVVDFTASSTLLSGVTLTMARRDMSTTRLSDGRVLLAGGSTTSSLTSPTASTLVDVFVPAAGSTPATIVSAASLNEPRVFHSAALLPGGNVLVSGGWTGSTAGLQSKTAEIFDIDLGKTCAATTECPTGRFCVDGVCCATSSCASGEVCNAPGREGLCVKGKGASCSASSECSTGFCVDGICCENACTGLCRSCALPGALGTCTIAAAGTDPRLSCRGSADPTCAKKCNGSGACATSYAPVGTPCGTSLEGDAGLPFCSAYTCTSSGSCTLGTNKCGLTCVSASTCDETTKSCSVTGTINTGTCLIDAKCYKSGETKPGDGCSICDPGSANTAWTVSLACDAGPLDTGTDAPADTTDDAPADTSVTDTNVEDTTIEDTSMPDTSIADSASPDVGEAETSVTPAPADLPETSACSCSVPGASSSSGGHAALAALGLIGAVVGLRRRARRLATSTVLASALGCSASAGRDDTPPALDSGADTTATIVDSEFNPDVGGMDMSLDETLGDAACAGKEVAAIKPPVDIIVVVDQSGSMSEEIAQVKTNINKLSDQLNKAYLDYRVVMIAKQGTSTYDVCVPPPLGGIDCKSNPPVYRASNQEVQSTDALQRILETYDNLLPSVGWRDMLRDESTKVFIPITDDNASTPKPVLPSTTVAQQFDAELLKRSDKFGTATKRRYRFYPICGASATDEFTKCGTGMVNTGPTYVELTKIAGGKWFPLCATDYGPLFIDIAKATAGEVACELTIPAPPAGETLDPNKINVVYTSSDGTKTEVVKQDTSATCEGGANGWQYNADKTKVLLCGDACTKVREDLGAKVNIQFGCRTKID